MGFRLQLLVYSLMTVVVSNNAIVVNWVTEPEYSDTTGIGYSEDGFGEPADQGTTTTISNDMTPQTIGNIISIDLGNGKPLASLNETLTIFMDQLNGLLNEIEKEKINFLENLEDERATRIFRIFNNTQCTRPPQYEWLKKSFILRFSLLESSLREAMAELRDKLTEMGRTYELEELIFNMKLKACESFNIRKLCEDIHTPDLPCLSDDCLPPEQQINLLAFNISKPDSQVRSGLTIKRPLSTDCPDGRFRCRSGDCTNRNYVCDGGYDCRDRSDESSYNCPRTCLEKRCRNLRCLRVNQICDGKDDCGDGTDEENCSASNVLVSDKFSCTNDLKVPYSVTCNGKTDCLDASDEGVNCSVTTGCDRCAAMGGACLRSPAGPLCLSSCPSGFFLDLESGLCILSDSTFGKRVIYKNQSFFGIINKIKSLFHRLSNGFLMMKKDLSQEVIRSLTKLKACIPEEHNS